MRVYLETLGCAKNQVDAEVMSDRLRHRDFTMTDDLSQADVAILNTCGFIQEAKEEAIARMIDLEKLRLDGALRCFVVTGCLVERYARDIYDEFPAVDFVLGVSQYGVIADRLQAWFDGDHTKALPIRGDTIAHLQWARHRSTHQSYAYLKIAEGCDRGCTYCAIPSIRGRQRSRHIHDIAAEAEHHLAMGRKELIIIAQDVAAFGSDLYGEPRLASLIRALDAIEGDFWLRLLYANPAAIGDDLVRALENARHLVPYLDMPIQHLSPQMLRRMARKETPMMILDKVKALRYALPHLTLRTTVMVGFPGETERDFALLRLGLWKLHFERLGCFIFSAEEGTRAYRMAARVAPSVAAERQAILLSDQATRVRAWQKQQIGSTRRVLIEEVAADGLTYLGRSASEAPDVDWPIRVYATRPDIALNTFVDVRIAAEDEHGLIGTTCDHDSGE